MTQHLGKPWAAASSSAARRPRFFLGGTSQASWKPIFSTICRRDTVTSSQSSFADVFQTLYTWQVKQPSSNFKSDISNWTTTPNKQQHQFSLPRHAAEKLACAASTWRRYRPKRGAPSLKGLQSNLSPRPPLT